MRFLEGAFWQGALLKALSGSALSGGRIQAGTFCRALSVTLCGAGYLACGPWEGAFPSRLLAAGEGGRVSGMVVADRIGQEAGEESRDELGEEGRGGQGAQEQQEEQEEQGDEVKEQEEVETPEEAEIELSR